MRTLTTEAIIEPRIDDLYILDLDGNLYLGRCYEGITCQLDPKHKFKHKWIAGWAHRIKQYTVLYRRYKNPKVKFVFDYDLDNNVIVIATTFFDADTDEMLEKVTQILQKFIQKYNGALKKKNATELEQLEEFENELLDMKLIPSKAKQTLMVKKRSLLKRLLWPLPGFQARLQEGGGYGKKKRKWRKERKVTFAKGPAAKELNEKTKN